MKKLLATFAAAAFCALSTSQSATVIWGTPTGITSDLDVSTTGTGVYAYAFPVSNTTSTVNGVLFNYAGPTSSVATPLSIGGGDATLSTSAGFIAKGDFSPNFTPTAPYTNLTSAYQAVISGGDYADIGAGAYSPMTLTLNNLSVAQQYQFQFWVNDSRTGAFNTRTETITAGNAVTLQYNTTQTGSGLGQWAIGTFTADATTQNFVIAGLAGDVPVAQINAFQLRAVPEPSTWVMATAGLTVLIVMNRRRASV